MMIEIVLAKVTLFIIYSIFTGGLSSGFGKGSSLMNFGFETFLETVKDLYFRIQEGFGNGSSSDEVL